MSKLQIGDGQNWSFLNGEWQDGPQGELLPPDGEEMEYMAVKHDEEYADFSASYRFKFRSAGGGARFLFRVQDSRRFYALDVPWNGQQTRSRHFWAGMVIADGTPLQRYLNFAMVPGLSANFHDWYDARVEAKGSRLRAWINDIPVADVQDSTYASGRVGFTGFANPYIDNVHFADAEIVGEPTASADWPGLQVPEPHWITPCWETDPETWQSYANLLQGQDGELLLHLTIGNPNQGETRRSVWVRSADAGRTWGEPEPARLQIGLGASYCRDDGTWVCIFSNLPIQGDPLYSYESSDKGQTWRGPTPLNVQGDWPEGWKIGGPVRPIRMHDGALVLPVIMNYDEPKPEKSTLITCCAAFVLRSEDDGQTWSAPVWCDSDHKQPGKPMESGSSEHAHAARYYELGMDEVADDVVLGIGRPERDPYMWKMLTNDGGRTWQPAAWGPFPGYCPSLTRTQSGAIVATTRFPYFAAHLSRDAGRTWEPPVIVDYAGWANQQAVLAEPETVVVTYMGEIMKRGQADSRIARIKVTDKGLVLDH